MPYYHLGEMARVSGDLDKATGYFNKAIALKPNYFEAQRDLGLTLYDKYFSGQVGSIGDSIDKLKQAERLVPDNPTIHLFLGKLYCAAAKLEDAETEFRKALMNDPRLAAAHFELGQLRYVKGDPDRALQEMKEAEKVSTVYTESKKYPAVDPKKVDAYEAKCYEALDRYPDAIDSWKALATIEKNANEETADRIKEERKEARAKK